MAAKASGLPGSAAATAAVAGMVGAGHAVGLGVNAGVGAGVGPVGPMMNANGLIELVVKVPCNTVGLVIGTPAPDRPNFGQAED